MSGALGQGVSFNLQKDIPNNPNSNLGYKMGFNLNKDVIGISPGLMYRVNPQITLTGDIHLGSNAEVSQNLCVSYSITKS